MLCRRLIGRFVEFCPAHIETAGFSVWRSYSNVASPTEVQQKKEPSRTIVFSGIQPTGSLHLGNYFGAVQLWTEIQKDPSRQFIASVVDMHAITLPWDPRTLRVNTRQMFVELLACGLDPDRAILFQQSHVPEHAQLQWIFTCLTTMARLDNLPQFKEKSATQKDIPCGLFLYPVLQAADILVYRSQLVPVGEDQVQHLQLAQHIARVFNNNHGKYFSSPERLHTDMPRVRSLRDPAKKMSKSDTDHKSRIDLADSPDMIRLKLKKSITDFTSEITYDPEKRPGVANLLMLYKTVRDVDMAQVLEDVKGKDKVQLKALVAESVIEMLKPIRERIEDLSRNLDYVERVMSEGADKARVLASATLHDVQNLVGFRSDYKKRSEIEAPQSIRMAMKEKKE